MIAGRAVRLMVGLEGDGAALAELELRDGIAKEAVDVGVVGKRRRGRRIVVGDGMGRV